MNSPPPLRAFFFSTSFPVFLLFLVGPCSIVKPCGALPPNTGMTLVADVAGTAAANDTYWAGKCTSIPSTALFLVLKMGDVLDFFKPADASTSYCDMLQARNKHQWSPNGVDWFAIEFYDPSNDNGGSAQWWPRDKGLEEMHECTSHSGVMIVLDTWADAAAPLLQWLMKDIGGNPSPCPTPSLSNSSLPTWGCRWLPRLLAPPMLIMLFGQSTASPFHPTHCLLCWTWARSVTSSDHQKAARTARCCCRKRMRCTNGAQMVRNGLQ